MARGPRAAARPLALAVGLASALAEESAGSDAGYGYGHVEAAGFPHWLIVIYAVEAAVFGALALACLAASLAVWKCVAPRQAFRQPVLGCGGGKLGDVLTTCLCPCVTFGRLAAALMPEHELSCLAWGCLYACCPKFQCCLRTWLRTELRKQAGIEGTARDDCLISCFLPSCALCQEDAEFRAMGGALLPPVVPARPVARGVVQAGYVSADVYVATVADAGLQQGLLAPAK